MDIVGSSFASFYNTRIGRVIKHIIGAHLRAKMPRNNDLNWTAIGYPHPCLDLLIARGIAMPVAVGLPGRTGGQVWPVQGQNRTLLLEQEELPFASNSLDVLVLMHALEFAREPEKLLAECARVLVGQGRLLVVAPNRRSLWAAADWSPMGCGRPFTFDQLCDLLDEHSLVVESHLTGLFVPPYRWRPLWRMAAGFERVMPLIAPAIGGLHIVEASKQQFSSIAIKSGQDAKRRGMIARPATAIQQ